MNADELLALADAAAPGPTAAGWVMWDGATSDHERAAALLAVLARDLARDHAALLKWAERAAAALDCDNFEFGTRGLCNSPEEPMCPSCALLAEFDVLRDRP